MPKGTRVEKIYIAILDKTHDKKIAAATAQKMTGMSLKTGKPLKKDKKEEKTK